MDSRIGLSAVVATALLLAAYANNAEATEPAKPAAAPPAFSSGDEATPIGSDAGGDKVAPVNSDAGGDKVAPAGSDAGGDKVAPEGPTPPGE